MTEKRFPCPACGYLVFTEAPGSEQTCPICGWIDDVNHLHFHSFSGAPNGISLLEAQRNFAQIGAIDEAHLNKVRFTTASDKRDLNWRPLDDDRDEIAHVPLDFDGAQPPEDLTELYYWNPK